MAGTGRALAAGTVISLAVADVWAYSTNLTAGGPPPVIHLTRNLPSDYAQLVSAPTGSEWALFAVVAVIYTLCLLAAGWRRMQDRGDS